MLGANSNPKWTKHTMFGKLRLAHARIAGRVQSGPSNAPKPTSLSPYIRIAKISNEVHSKLAQCGEYTLPVNRLLRAQIELCARGGCRNLPARQSTPMRFLYQRMGVLVLIATTLCYSFAACEPLVTIEIRSRTLVLTSASHTGVSANVTLSNYSPPLPNAVVKNR
jgi:hypothetical protein